MSSGLALPAAPPAARVSRAWLAALAIVVLSGIVCGLVLVIPSDPASDVLHYKYWTRQVATYGVSGSYSGTYPETAAIYPPVTMYGYRVVGWIYRHVFDSSFDMDIALQSQALSVLIRLVAVVPLLVGSLAIFSLLLRRYGSRPALLATAAIALNPATIFDTAYWGQPDLIHAGFLLIAIYLIEEDRPLVGCAFVGLALATKPQAWALLPLLAYVGLRRFGLVRSVLCGLVAGLAALVVCLPYIVYGTFSEIFILPRLISVTMPVVSANAHNVWWLVTQGKPDFVWDSDLLFGLLSYQRAATILTLLVMAYGFWRTNPNGRDGELSAMAAFLAFGWFMVTTRAHENHDLFALPLLVMATPRSRFLWGIYGLISLTLLLNMAMHDFGLEAWRESALSPEAWRRFQLANASVNVAILIAWSAWLLPRHPTRDVSRRTARPA